MSVHASDRQLPERRESLWLLAAPPTVWAAHFLLSYCTAAIWCAKAADPSEPLGGVRMAIAIFTVLALGAIGIFGWIGWKRHRLDRAHTPHDDDTPEDRHRFLGFATFLLAGLSAVAVIYAAMVPLFVGTCR